MAYRVLGHERVAFTHAQLEDMVRRGLLTVETKVVRDGEGFATAFGSRAEFQHLVTETSASEPDHRGPR